jgi:single-strand DNA-binding protein
VRRRYGGVVVLNRFELLGNLTHDPELQRTEQGTPYCHLRLATNRIVRREQRTDYHFVSAWYSQAEAAASHLHKGDRVFIEGRIDSRLTSRDEIEGTERIRLIANKVLFLSRTQDVVSRQQPEHIADVAERGAENDPAQKSNELETWQ